MRLTPFLFCYALIHYLEESGITFSNHVSMALLTPHYFPASVFDWRTASLEIFEQGRTLIQNGRDRKTGMLLGLRGRVKSAHLVLTKVQRGKLNIFTNVLYEIWVIIQGRIQEFLIGGPNCGKSEEQLPKKTVGQLCYHLM